jgi:hypothetical protein
LRACLALSIGTWAASGCGEDSVVVTPGPGLGGLGGFAGASSGGAGTAGSAGAPPGAMDAGAGAAGAGSSAELPGIPWDEDSRMGQVPSSDVGGQAMLALIERSCGRCHGDDPSAVSGGALDLTGLVDRGWIVPGSSEASPVVTVLAGEHVPVSGAFYDRPTVGELELLERFVNGLPVQAPECDSLPFTSPDEVQRAMASDISRLAPEVRPFARYVGLTDASNAGLCGAALELQRRALGQAFNATSTKEQIVLPKPIDELQVIFRIDLRDYGWDRGIDLEDDGVVDFTDGWQAAAAAAGAYGEEYRGPDADALAAAAGTAVPYLPAHALVHAVADGDLYSALIGVGADVSDHRSGLGIPASLELLVPFQGEEPVPPSLWAGIGDSREALVIRALQNRPERSYWLIHEGGADAETILDQPFEIDRAQNTHRFQISFALPNGLLGYAIEANDASRRSSAQLHGEDARVSLAMCSACHADGQRAVRDVVRDYVLANPRAYPDAVRELYVPQAELDATIESDSAIQRAALQQLGIPPGSRDPLSSVYRQFEQSLTIRRAAAELGVSLATFQAALATPGRLAPELAPLGTSSSIERATFTAALTAARCSLQQGSTNRPARCF